MIMVYKRVKNSKLSKTVNSLDGEINQFSADSDFSTGEPGNKTTGNIGNVKKNIMLYSDNFAWRIPLEIIAALIFSGGLGYGIDSFFGSQPLALIICLIFGVVAGLYNIYKIYA